MTRFVAFALVLAAACVAYWTYTHQQERDERLASTRTSQPQHRERVSAPNAAPTLAQAALQQDAPVDNEPAPPPGSVRRIELLEPPATHYSSPPDRDDAALAYNAVLTELRARGATYDPLLGRAAREVAFQHSFYDGTLPRAVLQFLLRSAGALDRSVLEGFTATNAKGPDAIRERALQIVDSALQAARGAPLRVGVGEAFVPGAKYPRFIAVLVSRRAVELEPTPVRARRGETWVLRGRLPPQAERPSALVMDPTGAMRTLPVRAEAGDRFTVELPCAQAGRYEVSVSASGRFGPAPLLQLPIYVDSAPPSFIDVLTPDAEQDVRTEADAAALAHRLLNHVRARHRLAALPRDPALDAIARAHAQDMRDAKFFGHRSPTTGDLGDRFLTARYRALFSSENLARAQTLGEATAGLYESLGHRRNLLTDKATVVGLGVALARPQEAPSTQGALPRDWLLAQVFAKPAVVLDPLREADNAIQTIAARRLMASVPALRRSARLDSLAARALADPRGPSNAVLDETNRAVRAKGGSWIWMATLPEPAALQLPDSLTQSRWTQLGIAFSQDANDRHGLVRVALLLAADR